MVMDTATEFAHLGQPPPQPQRRQPQTVEEERDHVDEHDDGKMYYCGTEVLKYQDGRSKTAELEPDRQEMFENERHSVDDST